MDSVDQDSAKGRPLPTSPSDWQLPQGKAPQKGPQGTPLPPT